MAFFKVIFLGKTGSGKTQLIQRMTLADVDFKTVSSYTIAPDILARKIDENMTAQLWDLPGQTKFEEVADLFMRGADAAVFCVDLNEKFDEPLCAYIKRRVEAFQQVCPDAPIILVGTKEDSIDTREEFEKIKALGFFSDFIATSAKDKTGTEALFCKISSYYERSDEEALPQNARSTWEIAVGNLLRNLRNIPENKQLRIRQELDLLAEQLPQNFESLVIISENEANAIAEFIFNCEEILEGKYSKTLKAVYTVAAVAFVTVVAAAIGFGIGFACGWWTGPGAFFTGLAAGYTAATAVTATSIGLGLVGGGLTAYSLFKTPNDITAINDFTVEIAPAI